MAQNNPFEFPQQLRELAEKNIEQGRAAYGQFMDAMVQASSAWLGSLPTGQAPAGFKTVQERSVQFAKQNAEACFALASELATAKDVKDILAIQSRFTQSQIQAYTLQAQDLGRLIAEAVQSSQQRS